jgi:hypothetical protein
MSQNWNLEEKLNQLGSIVAPSPSITDSVMWRIQKDVPAPARKRLSMLQKRIKLLTAATIMIVTSICIYHFGDKVKMSTIAFAEISEAIKKIPWMHQISRGMDRGVPGDLEYWYGFETNIYAFKQSVSGKIGFWDIKEHRKYYYDPAGKSNFIIAGNDFPLDMSSPVAFLEDMLTTFKEQGATTVIKETQYNGQKAQLQEITHSWKDEQSGVLNGILQLYIHPDLKLLLAAQVKVTDFKGNVIVDGETIFSYPKTGPGDIYDLGVPKDASVMEEKTNTIQEQK